MSQQPTDNTTKILETAEKIVENVTKSDLVEIVEVGGKTTTTIFKDLLASGGKPVAIILAIAVVTVATSVPIFVLKLSPSQINLQQPPSQNLPAKTSSSGKQE